MKFSGLCGAILMLSITSASVAQERSNFIAFGLANVPCSQLNGMRQSEKQEAAIFYLSGFLTAASLYETQCGGSEFNTRVRGTTLTTIVPAFLSYCERNPLQKVASAGLDIVRQYNGCASP